MNNKFVKDTVDNNHNNKESDKNKQQQELLESEQNFTTNEQLINKSNKLSQQIPKKEYSRRKAANLLKILNEHQQKQRQQHKKHEYIGENINNLNDSYKKDDSDELNESRQTSPSSVKEKIYSNIIQINCNSIVAELHMKKFGSGGKGKCIYMGDRWLTPIEFEKYCGKGNSRDWKRTIKVGGQPLISLLDENILICHAVSCACAACSDDTTVVGPIRPFARYRRRKRDEILAQNAFKKFLSLKPPTLMTEQFLNDIDNKRNNLSFNDTNPSIKSNNSCNTNTLSMSPIKNSSSESTEVSEYEETSSIKELELLEQKQWSLLEQAADTLMTQAQILKELIEQAKTHSRVTKQALLDELKQFNNNFNQINIDNNKRHSIDYNSRPSKYQRNEQPSATFEFEEDDL